MDDIQALKHFCETHEHVANENQMRWWIFHRQSNGIESSGAIVKKGGRWFVNVPKFREWILAGDRRAA
jgi:hypothetical protein